MALKKSLVEVTHDEGYGDSLLMHINIAFGGKDMRADKIVNPVASAVQVEGIPEGWELVRVGEVEHGDFFILSDGLIEQHDEDKVLRMNKNYIIIRKIEKPKKFRPFANAKEADSFWNAVLKFKNPKPELEDSRYRIDFITADSVGIGIGSYSYKSAFESFECIDGTPFGVEVTE